MTQDGAGESIAVMSGTAFFIYRTFLFVVAIMSGCLSLVRELLQIVDPVKYQDRPLFFSCLPIACIVAVGLLWMEEYKGRRKAEKALDASIPKLILSLGTMVWVYDRERNLTIFFLSAEMINRGEASVAINWSATYHIGNSMEQMQMWHLVGIYSVTVGGETLSLTNNNLINLKLMEKALAKGEYVGGRLVLTVPGDRTAQIESLQFKIRVKCKDYLGNSTEESEYAPSAEPLDKLVFHYDEQVALAKQPESASYIPLPPPTEG